MTKEGQPKKRVNQLMKTDLKFFLRKYKIDTESTFNRKRKLGFIITNTPLDRFSDESEP